ncbi:TetR/AcrR family transcriptional regulator [Nocardioides montaniterrae]
MATPKPDGRQVRWLEHNQQRRRVIVDAAVAVLESQAPGEEVPVQAVAERAGLSRTVIYRHFEDRADLDRAVQSEICDQLGTVLAVALAVDRRPQELVDGVVGAFVRWCQQHPAMLAFVERDVSDWGTSPLALAMEQIAVGIEAIMNAVVDALGFELSEVDRAGLEPWVFGIVGGAFAGVRRWLGRPILEPVVEDMAKVLSVAVWVQIDGMARSRGIEIPDEPLGSLRHELGGADDGS